MAHCTSIINAEINDIDCDTEVGGVWKGLGMGHGCVYGRSKKAIHWVGCSGKALNILSDSIKRAGLGGHLGTFNLWGFLLGCFLLLPSSCFGLCAGPGGMHVSCLLGFFFLPLRLALHARYLAASCVVVGNESYDPWVDRPSMTTDVFLTVRVPGAFQDWSESHVMLLQTFPGQR